ncbi:MAG: dockerin type I repeat-containing protein [candidate division Zixibacteria bacterium]|nr:dockerin type I repeat-containing protein [candidate division Zixibacteria bacterium]
MWSRQAIRLFLSMLFFLMLSGVSWGQFPYDQPIGEPDVPGTMTVNHTYTIRIYLQNGDDEYATSNGGYLDVSFPQPGRVEVDQGLQSAGWDSYTHYSIGSTIWNMNQEEITAIHPLFSAYAESWQPLQLRWIEIEVTPTQVGSFDIYYRRSMFDRFNQLQIAPQSSSYTDQQGWPVRKYTVQVIPSDFDFNFTDPDGTINVDLDNPQPVQIAWEQELSDPAYLSLAYDTDCNEGGHTWISVTIPLDPNESGDSYTWDIASAGLSAGDYRIWGFIYDGENDPVYDCAPGIIHVTEGPEAYITVIPEGAQTIHPGESAHWDVYAIDTNGDPISDLEIRFRECSDFGVYDIFYTDNNGHVAIDYAPSSDIWVESLFWYFGPDPSIEYELNGTHHYVNLYINLEALPYEPCPSSEQFYTLDEHTVAGYSFCSLASVIPGITDNSGNGINLGFEMPGVKDADSTDESKDEYHNYPTVVTGGIHGNCLEWGLADWGYYNYSGTFPAMQSFTLEFYLNIGVNVPTDGDMIQFEIGDTESYHYLILTVYDNGEITVNGYLFDDYYISMHSLPMSTDGTWHHVSLDCDASYNYIMLLIDDSIVDRYDIGEATGMSFDGFEMSGNYYSGDGINRGINRILLDEMRISNTSRFWENFQACPENEQKYVLDDYTVCSYSFCAGTNPAIGIPDNSDNEIHMIDFGWGGKDNESLIIDDGYYGSCLDMGSGVSYHADATMPPMDEFTAELYFKTDYDDDYYDNDGHIALSLFEPEKDAGYVDLFIVQDMVYIYICFGSESVYSDIERDLFDNQWHHMVMQYANGIFTLTDNEETIFSQEIEITEAIDFGSLYIDGGVIEGQMLVDEIRISNVARYCGGMDFQFGRDDWQFPNRDLWPASKDFPSWDLFVKAFGSDQCEYGIFNIPKPAAVEYWQRIKKPEWKGSCFGFSTTCFLFYDNWLNIEDEFPDNEFVYEVERSEYDYKAPMMINKYHLYQWGYNHKKYKDYCINNITPLETLEDCRAMFENPTDAQQILSFIDVVVENSETKYKGHSVNAYRCEIDAENPNIIFLYVYENDMAAEDDKTRVVIDTDTGVWSYTNGTASQYGPSNKNLFLMEPVSEYVSPPLLPPNNANKKDDELTEFTEIFLSTTDSAGFTYTNGNIGHGTAATYNTLDQGHAIIPFTGGESFIQGYFLPNGEWESEFSGIGDSTFYLTMFTANTVIDYERKNVSNDQTEKLTYPGNDSALCVHNPDPTGRLYSLETIAIAPDSEIVVKVSNMSITPGDSTVYAITPDAGLQIDNFGGASAFNLFVEQVGIHGDSVFYHTGVQIGAQTSCRIVTDFTLLTDSIYVLLDAGMTGTYDDTLRVENEGMQFGVIDLEPDTMYAIYANAVQEMMATIYFGDFIGGYAASDVTSGELLINDVIAPSAVSIESSPNGFSGDVLKVIFPVKPLIEGYGLLYDTTMQTVSLSGTFQDATMFNTKTSVVMIGHVSGDVNGDGRVNVADITHLIYYIYNDGPEPQPLREAGDYNNDGLINLVDVLELIEYAFGRNPAN